MYIHHLYKGGNITPCRKGNWVYGGRLDSGLYGDQETMSGRLILTWQRIKTSIVFPGGHEDAEFAFDAIRQSHRRIILEHLDAVLEDVGRNVHWREGPVRAAEHWSTFLVLHIPADGLVLGGQVIDGERSVRL